MTLISNLDHGNLTLVITLEAFPDGLQVMIDSKVCLALGC